MTTLSRVTPKLLARTKHVPHVVLLLVWVVWMEPQGLIHYRWMLSERPIDLWRLNFIALAGWFLFYRIAQDLFVRYLNVSLFYIPSVLTGADEVP